MDCDLADSCLFYRLSSGSRAPSNGVLTRKVDDTLFTGTSSYLADEEANAYRFPAKPYSAIDTEPEQFNGTFLSKTASGFKTSQTGYIRVITHPDQGTLSQTFASLRAKISYATNQTCPLQTCRLNMLSQISTSDASASDIKSLRSLLSELNSSANDYMQFQNLDWATTEPRVYTDASFSNNKDLSLQLGWCIYSADATARCNL